MKRMKLLVVTLLSVLCVGVCSCEKEDSEGDWVDLGLPSGLLWAKCNVGATKPEEYGYHYAWGETTPKEVYNWETYTLCLIDGGGEFTKYCYLSSYGYNGYTDSLSILQPVDDAATVALGAGARMPTDEEWEELDTSCTTIWTKKNGVRGYRFRGPNGNTIFLPAAGYRWDDSLYDAGSRGLYWSSSLWMDYPNKAWGYLFNWLVGYRYYNDRSEGFSVRAVCSAR